MSEQALTPQQLETWRRIAEMASPAKSQIMNYIMPEKGKVSVEVIVLDDGRNVIARGLTMETGDLLIIARKAILRLVDEVTRLQQYTEALENQWMRAEWSSSREWKSH